MQKLHQIRSDKLAWVTLEDLDREVHTGNFKIILIFDENDVTFFIVFDEI